ncbi:uncharacterized protein LOC129234780 [Uloborus diversus]|uniref:uncharacterized protein LOC129234780 n=1 Tax=Uloborus diversus TaxID=327109 RepID=UPI002409A1A2|nr:uncharacterized protein LOC129234780 [Uloborus diversus]
MRDQVLLRPVFFCRPPEEPAARFHSRGKRHGKKKISLMYLLKVICSSQETCLDWLKNKGLLPRVMFCPNCCRKMKFEVSEDALDGYIWECKECQQLEPPQFSSRHGSWLEDKKASLVDILLFTYLWSHDFNDMQIMRETNMSIEDVKKWNEIYTDICDALCRRKTTEEDEDSGGENILEVNTKESPVAVWRKKNKYRDPFIEFLKDADSL